MLAYSQIFKQAAGLIRTRKFLWLFGLFLVGSSIFNFNFLFSRADQAVMQQRLNDFSLWLTNHLVVATWLFLGFLLLLLVLMLLYFRARAGLIISIKAILEKQPASFSTGFQVARHFYWRLIGTTLLLSWLLLLAMLILGIPIGYLAYLGFSFRAGLLLILGVLIFAPVSVVISFMNLLAPIFICLHDLTIGESLKASFKLIGKYWPNLLLFTFYLILIMSLGFFVSLFLASIVAAPFVFLAYFFYALFGSVGQQALLVVAALLGTILFLLVQAALAAFHQASWVLLFEKLVRLRKLEQETEEAVAPEPIV